MKRVWFKVEMRDAILAGRKTATTRDHLLPLGDVRAVTGSRYAATPFAILTIRDRLATTLASVVSRHYREEGFASPELMHGYALAHGLPHEMAAHVWFHRFQVKERLAAPLQMVPT